MKFTRTQCVLVSSCLSALAMSGSVSRASVLLYEPFKYTGSSLNGNSGALGTSGSYATWVPANTPAAASLGLTSTSLAYPSGTTLVASGGSVSDGATTTQDGSYIPLATPISMSTPGTYYISFLVSRFGSASSQAFFGVDLNAGETAVRSAQDITFGCGSSGFIRTGGDNQSNSALANTIVTSGTYAVTPGSTSSNAGAYMIVGKIVSNGVSFTTYMSEYASATGTVPATEPASWEVTSTATADTATYTNLQIRKGAAIGTNIDEILIGTTYADVTQAQPVPEASAPMAGGALVAAVAMRRRRRA